MFGWFKRKPRRKLAPIEAKCQKIYAQNGYFEHVLEEKEDGTLPVALALGALYIGQEKASRILADDNLGTLLQGTNFDVIALDFSILILEAHRSYMKKERVLGSKKLINDAQYILLSIFTTEHDKDSVAQFMQSGSFTYGIGTEGKPIHEQLMFRISWYCGMGSFNDKPRTRTFDLMQELLIITHSQVYVSTMLRPSIEVLENIRKRFT